jgi:hypothetical protein
VHLPKIGEAQVSLVAVVYLLCPIHNAVIAASSFGQIRVNHLFFASTQMMAINMSHFTDVQHEHIFICLNVLLQNREKS